MKHGFYLKKIKDDYTVTPNYFSFGGYYISQSNCDHLKVRAMSPGDRKLDKVASTYQKVRGSLIANNGTENENEKVTIFCQLVQHFLGGSRLTVISELGGNTYIRPRFLWIFLDQDPILMLAFPIESTKLLISFVFCLHD